MTTSIRTRMAPSPTGEYHVGHIATLLKNYAYAKKHGGQFVLRIEDTDQVRKVDGAVEQILQVIKDYGLSWDEGPEVGGPYGPYVQSQRLELYKQYAQQLLDQNKAYYCFATPEELAKMRQQQQAAGQPPRYDGRYRDYPIDQALTRIKQGDKAVVRLKVPRSEHITFTDLIRGEITVSSDEVDDQVLVKSDGFPTYHLAVVVDDHLMKITHIMRGEEWISSTPKHVLLYQAFGWTAPTYAHVPVFLNPDGKGKMSKRKGTVSAQSFLDEGYLPEAMLNFFMILGWARSDQREIMTLDEYIQEFDPATISAKSVVFDLQKLAWINGVYIRGLSQEELAERIKPFLPADFPTAQLKAMLPLVSDRLEKLSDIEDLTSFWYRPIEVNQHKLLKKGSAELVAEQLAATSQALNEVPNWSDQSVENCIRELQQRRDWKTNQYFMMLRVAVTGITATPPLFETMTVLGQKLTIERLNSALTTTNQT